MKTQGESKKRNNAFNSPEIIHFTVDLIGPLYIFHILLNNILWNVGKIEFRKVLENWFKQVIA